MYDSSATIAKFLEAAAAKQPTPGGGSIAALSGAMAASMGQMCVNYSIGKKGLESHTKQFQDAIGEFQRARTLLLALMVEDQTAYEALTAAKRLAKDSPDQSAALASAVEACIEVPQSIAAASLAVLSLADSLVDSVNAYLLSDLVVCADLAMAAVRSALSNLRVNLPMVSDAKRKAVLESFSADLLARAVGLIQGITPRIWQRVG